MIKNLLLVLLLICSFRSFAAGDADLSLTAVSGSGHVAALFPAIVVVGLPGALSTTYGTASSSGFFTVSGVNLTAGLTVAAPIGFLVSLSSTTGFASSITVGSAGTVTATLVYIILSGQDNVSGSPYSGNVSVSSTGATTNTSISYTGTVNPFPFNINLSGLSLTYGSVIDAGTTTCSVLTGANGETITSIDYAPSAAALSGTTPAGTSYSVIPSNPQGSGTFLPGNYTFSYTTFSGTIQKALLTIKADTLTRTYGTVLGAGAGSIKFTSIGLQNNETILSVTIAFSAGNNGTSSVSTYSGSISVSAPSGGSFNQGNYTNSYANGDLIVSPASLTITGNTAKVYGTQLSNGTGSYSFTPAGLMNGETINTVTIAYGAGSAATDTVGFYSGAATPSAPTGGTFTASNYKITCNVGVIYIAKHSLYITASTDTKIYGSKLTSSTGFTGYTTVGLQNGEQIGSVSVVFGLGAAANAAVNVPAHTYDAQVKVSAPVGGTFKLSNYDTTFFKGNIVVNKESLAITANAVTKTYGQTLTSAAGQTAFTSVGLVNGETIGTVSILDSAGSAATAVPNIYSTAITPALATGGTFTYSNYLVSYVQADLLVSPALLSVSVTSPATTKVYGSTLAGGSGSLLFTPSGLQNGDVISSVTLNYNSGGIATAPVDTYTSAVVLSAAIGSTFVATNYTITYVPADLIVTKHSLGIKVSGVIKLYGALLTIGPGFTAFGSTGLQNGETISGVTATYGTGASATSSVGIYPASVTASLPVGPGLFLASNYTLTDTAGAITVNAAPLTISALEADKLYGVTLTGSAGSLAFIPGGLQNGETIGTVTIAYGSGSVSTDAVGTYTGYVTVSQPTGGTFTLSNYSVTYPTANIVISPDPVSITANTVSKTYGTAITGSAGSAAFTYPVLPNAETIGTVTITFGSGSAQTDAAGAYATSVSASAATGGTFTPSNYKITYVPDTLTVSPKALTITANSVIKIYGAVLVSGLGKAGFTSSALANGETLSSVTLTYGTGSAASAPVGSYPGVISAASPLGSVTFQAANYKITYQTDTITVSPATLIIAATGPTKVYGTALKAGVSGIYFLVSGLMNSESVDSVVLTPDATGLVFNTPAGTAYTVTPSAATGSHNFLTSNYAFKYINYTGTVTAAPLTITATGPAKVYGEVLSSGVSAANFVAQGLAAGETVVSAFMSADAAAQSAVTAAGSTYVVTPSAAVGNAAFSLSNYMTSYIAYTGTVSRAPLSILAVAATKVYGITLTGLAGSTAFTFSGIKNNELIGSVTLSYGAGWPATAAVKVYPGSVSVSLATGGTFLASNYMISFMAASLTVTSAPLVVTAAALSKTYGATLASASGVVSSGTSGVTAFTVAGLQNNETIGSVSSVIEAGGAATDSVGIYIGSSAVTAVTGGSFLASNYSISYIPATIHVNPAALSILANDTTKTYGTTITGGLVSAAYTTSGLQNGETFGPVTLAYGTGAAATAPAGIYTGSAVATLGAGGSFNLHNYSLSIFSGNITVAPATLAVTLLSVSKVFGTTLTGAAGSSGFTLTGLQNGETAGTITQAFGAGAPATAPAGTYVGATTGSLLTGGNFNAANYKIIYNAAAIIVGTGQTSLLVVSQPGCTSALGTISIVNYNAAYTYTLSPASIATQSGSLISAPAGTYTVTALAPHSFASPVSLSITLNPQPPIPNLIITNPLEVNAPAVVDIKLPAVTALSDAGLTYSYFTDVSGTTTLADPSAITTSGVYYIMATNSYGCTSPVKAVFVYVNPLPKLVITNPGPVNNPTTVDLTLPAVTAGSTPDLTYTYFSDSGATILLPDPAAITVSGTYYIRGTNGGGNSLVKPVIVVINFVIFIPNVFTPNGDGKNDRFVISGLEHFPGSTLVIYNRFGNVLYQSADYQNTWNGGGQTAGTYYYQLQLKKAGATIPYKGWVQILY